MAEAFAERLNAGDRFLLDGRCLEYRRRHGNALVVGEVVGRPAVPRWGGDGWPLSPELAQRLYVLRIRAAEALRDGSAALAELLRREYGLQDGAADDAGGVLPATGERQRNPRNECLSHRGDGPGVRRELLRPHAVESHRQRRPGAVAVHRLVRDDGYAASSIVADLGFALLLRRPMENMPENLRRLLADADFAADLDASLSESQMLRERFRRVATTGLMLLRNPLGRRRRVGGPSWGEQQLFDQVRQRDAAFRAASSGAARGARRSVRPRSRDRVCTATAVVDGALSLAIATVAVRGELDAASARRDRDHRDGRGSAPALARALDRRITVTAVW